MVDTSNTEGGFDWQTKQTFPKKTFKGVECVGSIVENSTGNKQLVLKKVAIDDSNFPRGLAKQFWFPKEHARSLAEYILANIPKEK